MLNLGMGVVAKRDAGDGAGRVAGDPSERAGRALLRKVPPPGRRGPALRQLSTKLSFCTRWLFGPASVDAIQTERRWPQASKSGTV